MKMNPVVHFELPAVDSKRMAEFYTKTFGWHANQMGPEMGNYTLVTTTEMGDNNLPKEPGHINGGFYQKTKEDQHPSIVIAVDDIHEAMKKVKEAGGTVLGGMTNPGEPDEIPGVGWFSGFLDSEGNRLAMLQPLPRAQTPS